MMTIRNKTKCRLTSIAAFLLITIFMLTGCGQASTTQSSVELQKDGTVKAEIRASFKKDYYSLEEMEKGIRLAVDDYNDTHGAYLVEMEEATVRDDWAEVLLYFRKAEDYAAFNNEMFYAGSLKTAADEGLVTLDTPLVKVDPKAADAAVNTLIAEDWQILICREPLLLKVPGRVGYVSNGLRLRDDGWVDASLGDPSRITLETPVFVIYK
ncbi:MAG: hypothetical protein Q4B73_10070 [Lachnospiraceae bacterium]|nr:hypothetical protein [Lachnospiraceae bacterium]